MAIRLAFSTTACPDWPIDRIVEQANAYGYTGVVLHADASLGTHLASDPAQVRRVFAGAEIQAVCLATPTALHHRDGARARAAVAQIERDLELAAKLGCPCIRIFGGDVEAGQNQRTVITRIAERVRALGDRAGELGVQILFENAGGFARAQPWWWLLDIVAHPMVALAWNAASAASPGDGAAGELPSVSIPTLHTRIRLVIASDVNIGNGAVPVPLGEGTVGIEQLVKRLLGIGYDGYLCVEWNRLKYPTLAPAEEYLPVAYNRLRGWLDAVAKSIEDAKPKPKPVKAAH